MRGKLAKILRFALIGSHAEVVKERNTRECVWETEVRWGKEKKICLSAPVARRAYKKFKEAYTHAGESRREMSKDIKRVQGVYQELHRRGIDRKVLAGNSSPPINSLKS